MKLKLIPAAIAGALVLSVGCDNTSVADTSSQSAAAETTKSLPDQVLVTVNGQPITGGMFGLYFNERTQTQKGSKNAAEAQNKVINELINVILLAQEGEKAGLGNRPDVAMAMKLKRIEILSRAALAQYAAENAPPEDELKQVYEEQFTKGMGTEYKASHILVKTEDEAKQLIEKLNAGGDFAELAKAHSTGPTGKNGGDLGWFDGAQMVKPFSDAVAKMEKGTVNPIPVQTQFGWHVIELEESRSKEPPSYESVRIRLMNEIQRKKLTDHVNEVRAKAKVVVNEALAQKNPSEEASK